MTYKLNPDIPADAQRYFTNARGVNYVPPMRTEWASTGGIPRFPPTAFNQALLSTSVSYDMSSIFGGSNKTSMWWYYNSSDNDYYLSMIKNVGMNCIRVFLDYYVWEARAAEHLEDIKDFLSLCDKYKIRCQFVTWDGIQIAANDAIGIQIPEPTDSNNPSSVPHGLAATWHKVPHAFEYSSTVQAQDFFDNRATPYLDALISVVKPYNSMWSFDVQNELDNDTARVITSATAHHLSTALSSVGVKMTIGNGAGYDPGWYQLYANSGGASGSEPIWYTPVSSVLDFASLHTYANSKFSYIKYVNQGISGAADTGIPAMYNESTNYDAASYPAPELDIFYGTKDFGGMIFDGFIENSLSREPFLAVQGLFYADGTVKSVRDLSSYSFYASSENWFSPNQLQSVFEAKETSVNGGIDGGFFSGTPATVKSYNGNLTANFNPKHLEYSEDFSGITEDDWIKNRHAVYYFKSLGIPLVGGENVNAAINYPPQPGHDMDLSLGYNFATSGLYMDYFVEEFFNLSSLASLASFSLEGEYVSRNNQLLYMNSILYNIMYSTFDSNIHDAVRRELTDTQWDYNIACTPVSRQELEDAWEPLIALSTSSIVPTIDNRQLNTGTFDPSDFKCHATSRCLYTGGAGVPGAGYVATPTDSDIDWDSYDTFYDTLIEKMGICVQQHINYATTTDTDYSLS